MAAASDQELADLLGDSPLDIPVKGVPTKNLPTIGTREYWKERASKVQMGPERIGLPKYAGTSKCTPARLTAILDGVREMPVVADVLRRVRLSTTSLKMWLAKSEDGQPGDGFDICLNPEDPEDDQEWVRFHEAYNEAMSQGVARLETTLLVRATGYREELTYQGHVIFKDNPDLLELGFTGAAAWLRDENGNPIPETIFKQDPDCLMFALKARKPEVYGNKQQVDVMHRGGVLVVQAKAATGQELNQIEESYKNEAVEIEFEEVPDDNT